MNTKFLTGVALAALLSMSAAAQAQDGAAAGDDGGTAGHGGQAEDRGLGRVRAA